MQDEQIREALNPHWRASAAGDADVEHVPGATSIHSERYGILRRQGSARDTVFRGCLLFSDIFLLFSCCSFR